MKLTLRIWVLIIFLLLSTIVIINFQALLQKGVEIKDIEQNSSAFTSGLKIGDIITSVNNMPVENIMDYSKAISSLFKDKNESVKVVINTKDEQFVFYSDTIPPIKISELRKTNIRAGLDLQGGARALVKPEEQLTKEQMQDLISISNQRLNVYGISDVSIRQANDLSGNNYMLVEIAGATPKDLENLIARQGKFEAKIGNETVFIGGNNDITYVCRNDANCARVDRCQQVQSGYFCNYHFVIHLSEEAAKRHAKITGKLGKNVSNPGYLDKQIDFYVDDELATSLFISENLKGQETTQIQIQGSGSGVDQKSAISDAENSMKQMQTILITGSLPYKLEIVKLDTISPVLGKRFTYLILLTGLIALIAVSVIVFIRYRNIKASIAILFTSFSEVVILLGIAAFIKWNLDLPSIVGILVMIGTGVDQQIVILDESRSSRTTSMKEKLKGALFIVIAAFITVVASLLPLFWAGAGLLKGFAVTTLIGLTVGVLITRPAFADIIKLIDKSQ
ncbi:MAG: MMPL family transporter [Candidatus Pacearchaeota archaeon]